MAIYWKIDVSSEGVGDCRLEFLFLVEEINPVSSFVPRELGLLPELFFTARVLASERLHPRVDV